MFVGRYLLRPNGVTRCVLPGLGDSPTVRMVADKVSFPEGPCYADGQLYFVEYGAGKALHQRYHVDAAQSDQSPNF